MSLIDLKRGEKNLQYECGVKTIFFKVEQSCYVKAGGQKGSKEFFFRSQFFD